MITPFFPASRVRSLTTVLSILPGILVAVLVLCGAAMAESDPVGTIRVKTARVLGASQATAFAVADRNWATAAHAPDGCSRIWLDGVPRLEAFPATIDGKSDLAVLLATSKDTPLGRAIRPSIAAAPPQARILGFAGGRAAALKAKRIGRVNLVYTGRQRLKQVAWVYFVPDAVGYSLRGISGGPAVAADGTVFGVIVAASARGRVYVLDFARVRKLVKALDPNASEPLPMTGSLRDYVSSSDRIRRLQCTR